MAYKCSECGAIFDEPEYEEPCLEVYNGVASLFPDRHYATFANCPECGEPIDTEYDTYDEEEEGEEDEE